MHTHTHTHTHTPANTHTHTHTHMSTLTVTNTMTHMYVDKLRDWDFKGFIANLYPNQSHSMCAYNIAMQTTSWWAWSLLYKLHNFNHAVCYSAIS